VSNPLKYVTSTPTGTLRHANLGAGVASIQYDETFNSGLNPSTLTTYYLVYEPVEGTAVRIYAPANATELIQLAQSKGSTETTEAGALTWLSDNGYYPANKVLDNVVTDDLALNLDSRTATSYPRSGTNWLDLSGEGNDSSLINSPTFNSNGYLEFDGTDDYCSIPNSTSLQNASNVTLEAWVKLDTNVGYYAGIIGKGTSDSNEEYCILILPSTGKLYMDVGQGGGPYVNAGYTFAIDTWYHIMGTHERVNNVSTIKVYVNGVYQPSTTNGSGNTPNSNTTAVTIGSRFSTGGNPWPGGIAKVGIYTQTLTQAEINQNYFQGPIVTDDLYFAMDASNLVSFEPNTTAVYNLTGSFAAAAGDAVLNNGVSYSDSGNGSWSFGGGSSPRNTYIRAGGSPGPFDLPGWDGYTIDVWVRRTAFGTWTSGTTNYDGIWNYYWNHSLSFSGAHTGLNYINGTGLSAYTIQMDRWYNVIMTHDNNSASNNHKVYIDGELQQTSTVANPTLSSGNIRSFYIGNWDASWSMVGEIGILQIYDRYITDSEASQNYNAYKKKYN